MDVSVKHWVLIFMVNGGALVGWAVGPAQEVRPVRDIT